MNRELCRPGEIEYKKYSDEHWDVLRSKRRRAVELSRPLMERGIKVYMYGSLARGDVKLSSDVDLIILNPINPAIILSYYSESGMGWRRIYIVQATPSHTPKVYIWFDDEGKEVVSFPLAILGSRESEFFKFGGLLEVNNPESRARVGGVDKRLMYIRPTDVGHVGMCILGREGWVAGELGVSEAIVRERVNVLSRRARHGRTGVFLEYEVTGDIMEAIEALAKRNEFFAKKLGL